MLEVVQTLNFRYRIKLFGRYERNRLPSESRHPISPATTHSKALRRAQALKALRDLIQFSLSILTDIQNFSLCIGIYTKVTCDCVSAYRLQTYLRGVSWRKCWKKTKIL